MNDILGKWRQPQGQPFPGLYFEFHQDGTFLAVYEEMEINSSGTYTAYEGSIDIDQTQNTLGLLGKFLGLYAIQGEILTMTLGNPAHPRPESLEHENKRLYKKVI
jgi:hypothetical protein